MRTFYIVCCGKQLNACVAIKNKRMSLPSQPTQNVIDHIFTAAYSYTNVSGFQVQINTQLDGTVSIGNVDTCYNLFINGLTVSELAVGATPYTWANFPAINTVNLSGNWLTSLSGGTERLSVNVCGALVVTDGINVANGNIAVARGNFVTASGNIVAHGNIAIDCNANIGGSISLSGTVNAERGYIYNTKRFNVNGNGGTSNYTGSNSNGLNYIGYVQLENIPGNNYLFLTATPSDLVMSGANVEIKTINASSTNSLNLVVYSSPGVWTKLFTINDTLLHKFVYFGDAFTWVQLY